MVLTEKTMLTPCACFEEYEVGKSGLELEVSMKGVNTISTTAVLVRKFIIDKGLHLGWMHYACACAYVIDALFNHVWNLWKK